MNAETFFESFDLLAEAPNSVAKLRELILQLAVQGKLVPHDPVDESASKLLERIAKEKQRLAESTSAKIVELPAIQPEACVNLPLWWSAVRLGSVIHLVSGQHLKPQEYNEEREGHPYLTGPADFGPRHPTATRWTVEERALAIKSDILITVKGAGIGKTNILATKTAFISRQLMAVRPIIADPEFVHICLLSAFDKFQDQGVGIAIPGIGRDDILLHPVFMPPLAEQRRIVAKVDELLGLCDELETRQGARRELRERLVQAALDQLLASRDPAEFDANWQRIHANFDVMFDTQKAVERLRQVVLQLAGMGKLVDQRRTEKPADKLLDEIKYDRQQLVAAKEIPNQRPVPEVKDTEVPFELPRGWKWARFGDACLYIESGWSPKCEERPRVADEWGVLKISAVTWDRFNPYENKALPANLEARPGCEVKPGDFLMSRANTAELVAKSVVVDSTPSRLLLNDKLLRVIFPKGINPSYINLVNNGPFSRQHYIRVASGTSDSMRNVSRDNVLEMLIPVPPQEEQTRIVLKANGLLEMCGRLSDQLRIVDKAADQLTVSAVRQLLAAEPKPARPCSPARKMKSEKLRSATQ